MIAIERVGFALRLLDRVDYDPYGWPTVHAPSGSPAKFGDPVVGLLAIRSGQVGALEGSLTNSPLLSGRELWQWYTNEPGGDPMLVESETTRAPHASTGWRHLYTGRTWDSQSRSYYYRHRWYDPHQARFLSRDALRYADGLLQYGYVRGNPIMMIDPTGLKDVYVIVNQDDDEAEDQCEAIQDDIDPEADIYRAKTSEEFDTIIRHISNDTEPLDSLCIVSHGGPGQLSTTEKARSDAEANNSTFDYESFPPAGGDSINYETQVWFYSCNMAQDSTNTSWNDWQKDNGPGWSRYFNGARIFGNTGKASAETGWPSLINGLGTGSGKWVSYP